jgi:hypothetical protein
MEMDPSSQQIFCGHCQPQGHNKQEPTTLILPYDASNKYHCRDKKEFHWLCGVACRIDFKQIMGCKNQQWTPADRTIFVATDSPKDITNRNQPLLFFHMMHPTNTIVGTRESFIGSVVWCRVDFE